MTSFSVIICNFNPFMIITHILYDYNHYNLLSLVLWLKTWSILGMFHLCLRKICIMLKEYSIGVHQLQFIYTILKVFHTLVVSFSNCSIFIESEVLKSLTIVVKLSMSSSIFLLPHSFWGSVSDAYVFITVIHS